jgi:hypothetical protein
MHIINAHRGFNIQNKMSELNFTTSSILKYIYIDYHYFDIDLNY